MIEAMQLFIEVANLGSFSQVAIKHNVAVSSVSRKIDALESDLGVKLFRRSSRAIVLTDSGEQFLPRARHIVAEMEEARQILPEIGDNPSGLLTVTAPSAFGRRHLMPAISSFMQQYPLIKVELYLSDTHWDLTSQRIDVAIRIGNLADSDLVASKLTTTKRIACASPEYLAKHGYPETPEALLQHNCLTINTAPLPQGWWCFSGINKNNPLPISGSFTSDDTETLLSAACAGLGVVHLANWLVYDALQEGRLIELFPSAADLTKASQSSIHAVWLPGRSHKLKTKLFVSHLKEYFGNPPFWEISE